MLSAPRLVLANKTESITPRDIECTADIALPLKFRVRLRHFGDPLRTVRWEDSLRLVVMLSFCPFIATGPSLLSIHFSITVWSALVNFTYWFSGRPVGTWENQEERKNIYIHLP